MVWTQPLAYEERQNVKRKLHTDYTDDVERGHEPVRVRVRVRRGGEHEVSTRREREGERGRRGRECEWVLYI